MLNNLQECGNLILRINEAAYETREEDFQARVLSDIDRVIGFDRAWWGIMSPVAAGGFRLLSSLPGQPARVIRRDLGYLHA